MIAISASLFIGLAAGDVLEVLKAQRAQIKDVEFHYETETEKLEDGKRVGEISRDEGAMRFHHEGVFYHSRSKNESGGRRLYEESTRLGANYRWKMTDPDPREPPNQRIEEHRSGLPIQNLGSLMTAWPTLRFALVRSDQSGTLTNAGTEEIDGATCERIEGRWERMLLSKYWLDFSRQASLVRFEQYDATGRVHSRVHSVVHQQVPAQYGVSIWMPRRFVAEGFVPAGEYVKKAFVSRCVVSVIPSSVKVNTGRTADETEVQFAAGAYVRDARQPTALVPGNAPKPGAASAQALKEAVAQGPKLADVPRSQPSDGSGWWWWLLVGVMAGAGVALLVARQRAK